MEEALSYCFDFVRDTGKTWFALKEYPEYRIRFQKLVFPEKQPLTEKSLELTKYP